MLHIGSGKVGELSIGNLLALISWYIEVCQTLIQLLSHSPSSTGQGKKTGWKGLWVETDKGRLLINYCHDQNRGHI